MLMDYKVSISIMTADPSFKAIIMAAMRKADTDNLEKLQSAFPEIWDELLARYNAPGGYLPGEYKQEEQ